MSIDKIYKYISELYNSRLKKFGSLVGRLLGIKFNTKMLNKYFAIQKLNEKSYFIQ